MSGSISSDDGEQLLRDRVKFKLYATKQHLDALKNIKQSHGSIMRSSEIRVKTEMEIDCFLAHIIGAKDSLLIQINHELGLRLYYLIKTVFLLEIAKGLDNKTYFMDATSASGPGIIDYLFENNIKYLLVDEIDKLQRKE